MAHQARKRFGQNFLVDEFYIERIIRAVEPAINDQFIEIGPGQAALTGPLLKHLNHLYAIEIDRDLALRLKSEHSSKKLSVIEKDVLQVDFATFGNNLRLIGNLPYNISSPLLFHLLPFSAYVRDQHFMLQKDVVDRMVAKAGDSNNSRLSIMLQLNYRITKLFDVPPTAFDPAPKVVSSIVRMIPLGDKKPQLNDEALFSKLVAQAFSQRRKMLRKSLASFAIDFDALGIQETTRPEQLGVDDFVKLANALS